MIYRGAISPFNIGKNYLYKRLKRLERFHWPAGGCLGCAVFWVCVETTLDEKILVSF